VGPAATMIVVYSWLSHENVPEWGENEVLGKKKKYQTKTENF